jgi:protein-disulfide isomerase
MSKGSAIIGMLISMVVGFFLGGKLGPGSGSSSPLAVIPAAAVPDANVDRYKIPLTGKEPARGADRAKVTIVMWSDFQCPFCSRVEGTLEQILKTYSKDVKVVWHNNPLPFHNNAMPAALAAMEAHAEGKFWKMHDIMFKNQQALDRPSIEKYAAEAGVDVEKVKAAIDQNKYAADIKAEQAEAEKVGARGTPAFFINGRPLSGAQPFDSFKKVIDEEIANADKAIKAGVPVAQVYDALTRNAKAGAAKPDAQKPSQPAQAQQDPNAVYKVPVGNSPQKGPATAKVTIIQFSDFQCPFCSRVEPTISELMKDYGKDLRVVWKNNPLPFHPNAMPAALASMAANEQGKFWDMHERLFKDQQHLDEATYEKYAGEMGLNVGKWKAAFSAKKYEAGIKEDMALAEKFGARGTPSFFINGRPLRGAQPKDAFKAVIDKEIEAANALLKKGVKPADLYTELTKNGKDKLEAAAAPPAAARPGEPDANTVYKALLGDAPVHGAKNAKVTIVMWSDFQCPFCSKVEPTVKQVMDTYPNDVRVAFKQLPLPFHDKAHAAAEAALEAKAQGKFWEMHDKMFANQQSIDRPGLEKLAGEIGLNMDKFKAALDSGKWKQKVDQEQAEGNKIGARGTPSFFINGKSFVGAQPFDAFKGKIDEELKNADAMIKKGTPVAKLYDELMKNAKAEVAAAPAAAADAGPDANKVYKVDAGNGPSLGDKSAPVQIVEFSDFQCPFCSRVVPTVKEIEDKYKGKVRLTFRNYPLPFHDKAQLAAEAGLAANEQGKFWEMHDKMFANQQTIDRPGLEKLAGEIGLNMDKFKSALDSGKYKAAVAADVTYANGLGTGGMGTPTFFINGRQIAGAMPFDAFKNIIDEELKKKGK